MGSNMLLVARAADGGRVGVFEAAKLAARRLARDLVFAREGIVLVHVVNSMRACAGRRF